ncbi:DENN domain-containing protein 4C [Cichlidogyrus casuarinus]|uniref:DENN domain-containing protein 4C n=1 Tax=Cichlidogyrus casuarinus TaxID=1844966 RepID=A0ABD2QMZ7_9PLAT
MVIPTKCFLEMSNLFDNFVVAGLSDDKRTDLNTVQLFNHAEEILQVDSAEMLDFTRYPNPLVKISVIDLKAKESVPDGFHVIEQTPGGHSAAFNDVVLLEFQYQRLELDQVPEFCLPWGATIESWNVKQHTPDPTYSNFVLTTADSEQVFGAFLSFYEPYDLEKMTLDECYRLGCDPEILHARRMSSNNLDALDTFTQEPKISLQLLDNLGPFFNSMVGERVVAVTKSICFLSKHSFSETFESFLRALHKRCLATDDNVPIERLLAYFFYEIPLPSLKTPTISVKLFPRALDTSLLLSNDHFSLANSKPLQISLEILGPELLINVLVHLLMEQKMLITSILDQRLTPFCQAIVSMLFPFRWTVCYVPFIHLGIVQIIQSPSPYLIGANSRFFDFFKLPSTSDIAYLDVDTANFVPARLDDGTEISSKLLPKFAYKSLLKKLTDIKKAFSECNTKFKSDLKARSQLVKHDSTSTNHMREEYNLQVNELIVLIRGFVPWGQLFNHNLKQLGP